MNLYNFLKDIPLEVAVTYSHIKLSITEIKYIPCAPEVITLLVNKHNFCTANCPVCGRGVSNGASCFFYKELTEEQRELVVNLTNIFQCICYLKKSYQPLKKMLDTLGNKI